MGEWEADLGVLAGALFPVSFHGLSELQVCNENLLWWGIFGAFNLVILGRGERGSFGWTCVFSLSG